MWSKLMFVLCYELPYDEDASGSFVFWAWGSNDACVEFYPGPSSKAHRQLGQPSLVQPVAGARLEQLGKRE